MKTWKGFTNERAVRKTIAELRKLDNGDNFIIVSTSGCKGFYKTDDPEDILRYKKETLNRAKHTFAPLGKVNRILMESDTQLEFAAPNKLREAREAAGLKAKDVIPIIQQYDPNFNKVTMSMIENDKAYPTALQLKLMSRLYKQSTTELVGMEIVSS